MFALATSGNPVREKHNRGDSPDLEVPGLWFCGSGLTVRSVQRGPQGPAKAAGTRREGAGGEPVPRSSVLGVVAEKGREANGNSPSRRTVLPRRHSSPYTRGGSGARAHTCPAAGPGGRSLDRLLKETCSGPLAAPPRPSWWLSAPELTLGSVTPQPGGLSFDWICWAPPTRRTRVDRPRGESTQVSQARVSASDGESDLPRCLS